MTRILQMIGSLEMGGSQAMIMSIYRNVDRSKVQFDFIIDHSDNMHFADEIQALGGRIYVMPTFIGVNIREIKKSWEAFFKEHQEYSILHSHVRSYASIYFSIAKKYGVKTIIHSHSTSNGKGIKSLIKYVLQYPLRYQADYFMACSKEAGRWLFGKKVVLKDNFYIIQNAIDTSKYEFDTNIRRNYRNSFGIINQKVFIHIGRLHIAKNHEFLIEMFCKLLESMPDALLFLVGEGELRNSIERLIEEKKAQNNIILLGNRDDVPNLLQMADCFLFPSKWEGLPMTVVEAQASGIPCLISNHITKEIELSDLVKYISIDEGVDKWIDEIKDINYARKSVIDKIKEKGFDIEKTAFWLQNFYLRQV